MGGRIAATKDKGEEKGRDKASHEDHEGDTKHTKKILKNKKP